MSTGGESPAEQQVRELVEGNESLSLIGDEVSVLPQKELLILGLLLGFPDACGQDLVRLSAGGVKLGTVYVTLDRMEEKGLVASEPLSPGLSRRRHRVTELGRKMRRATLVARMALLAAQGSGG